MMYRTIAFILVVAGLCGTSIEAPAQEHRPVGGEVGGSRPELQRRGSGAEARVEVEMRDAGRRVWCTDRRPPQEAIENCGYANAGSAAAAAGFRSYSEAHEAFHQHLDLKYRALAASRPLDLRRQLDLRARKSAEHDRWHAEMGRRHD